MGSGKVYFWDSATNAVAWDPPVGSTPRTKEANAATFAEAHDAGTDTAPQDGDEVESDATMADSPSTEGPPTSQPPISDAPSVSEAPPTSGAENARTPPGSLSPEPLPLSQPGAEDAFLQGDAGAVVTDGDKPPEVRAVAWRPQLESSLHSCGDKVSSVCLMCSGIVHLVAGICVRW
jgi:hypothetical protein